jgi:hypothetical protein
MSTQTLLRSLRQRRFGTLANAERATGILAISWRQYERGLTTPNKRRRQRIQRIFGGKSWAALMQWHEREGWSDTPVRVLRDCRRRTYGNLRNAAAALGISKTILCEIERGRLPSPRLQQLLEEKFAAPIEQLMVIR